MQPRHSLSLLRHAHPESAGVTALQSAVNPASRTVTLGIVTGFVIFAVVNFAGLRFHRCSNHDQIASEIRYPQQLSTGGRKPTTTCSSPFLDISMKCDFFASNYERITVTLLTVDTIELSSAGHCRSLAWRASRCARYSRSFGAGRCQAGCRTLVRETTIFTSSF